MGRKLLKKFSATPYLRNEDHIPTSLAAQRNDDKVAGEPLAEVRTPPGISGTGGDPQGCPRDRRGAYRILLGSGGATRQKTQAKQQPRQELGGLHRSQE